jgi:sec-independent protein translocase protein TatA
MNIPQLALIGPIGGPEMIMIFVVILLLFGAKKLPELARGVGKSMGEFKKAREEFEHEITRSAEEVNRDERPKEASPKPAAGKESHEA